MRLSAPLALTLAALLQTAPGLAADTPRPAPATTTANTTTATASTSTPAAASSGTALDKSGSIEFQAPIRKFSLPRLTPAGVRTMLLRGDEARLLPDQEIDLVGMQLSLFDDQNPSRVETLLTAASARFFAKTQTATGDKGFTLHRDDVEMSGTRWTYIHKSSDKGKKVVIEGNVRVIFNSQLGEILK